MRKQHLPSGVSGASKPASRKKGCTLSRCVDLWLADGEASGWSERTVKARRAMMANFIWWLEQEGHSPHLSDLAPELIRLFLAYTRRGAEEGRWKAGRVNTRHATRPSTVDTYYRCLRAVCNFAVREGLLGASPLTKVTAPRVPKDQVQPFTLEQVQALLSAAKQSDAPKRNLAILLVLIDTGLRVSELCSLKIGCVDPDTKELTVTGKGGKRRKVFLSPTVRRALWQYVEHERRDAGDDEPLFVAVRGRNADCGLTPSGVCQIFHRLGDAAGIRDAVRCSPHTARHFYAVTMLRNGANLFELQQLMGHEDLTVLRRYIALAEADLAQVHRKASPVAGIKI